jgi:transcriptional regulator with XRE-family HTH domain
VRSVWCTGLPTRLAGAEGVALLVNGPGDDHSEESALRDDLKPSQLLAARLSYLRRTYVRADGTKWTLEELAEFVRDRTRTPERPDGVGTKQYMWRLENGTPGKSPPKPNADVLRALADAFAKEPAYFLSTPQDAADAIEAQLAVYTALKRIGARAAIARRLVDTGFARVPGQSSGQPPAAHAAALWSLAAAFDEVPPRERGEPMFGEPHDGSLDPDVSDERGDERR